MNKIDKLDKELEKSPGEGCRVAGQNPGARKAETGGRKQPDRAGGALPQTDARPAYGFSERPQKQPYAKPLTEKQMEDYELKPAPGNPDRVRPSITARLKEGTRGQEPQKEPGQKRSHKNHEER